MEALCDLCMHVGLETWVSHMSVCVTRVTCIVALASVCSKATPNAGVFQGWKFNRQAKELQAQQHHSQCRRSLQHNSIKGRSS